MDNSFTMGRGPGRNFYFVTMDLCFSFITLLSAGIPVHLRIIFVNHGHVVNHRPNTFIKYNTAMSDLSNTWYVCI